MLAGVGAYSEVYQVTRKSDGIEYALKQVSAFAKYGVKLTIVAVIVE